MTKARNIANIASDGSALADGTINYTDVSGTPTLATVATSGSFNDLSNQPAAFDPNTLATVAVSGAYADVTGTPTLAAVATSGAYADLASTPILATVATTGAYADVTGTPAAALPPANYATVATIAYGRTPTHRVTAHVEDQGPCSINLPCILPAVVLGHHRLRSTVASLCGPTG